MSEPASDKSRHVSVDVSEARIARLWGNVSARLEQRPAPRTRFYAFGAAVALAAVFAVTFGVVRAQRTPEAPQASVWEGARLETSTDRTSVSLVDGSKLTLDPDSRVAVQDRSASAVKLSLERGRLSCDVTHRPGRSFVVMANGVEVRVVGTRFSVLSEKASRATRVEVRVERGVVEVRAPGGNGEVARVEAGQSWSQLTRTDALGPAEPSAEPAAAAVEAPAPSAEAAAPSVEARPAVVAASVPSAPSTPSRGAAAAAASSAEARAANAKELFEQASGLWRAGRAAEAAQAYQTLLSTYPRDARAGLAAFELGRLRMDRLGDPAGALKALERAVAAPGSGFREDALARIVSASSSLGQSGRCTSAREQYLREYPNGVHRLRVAKACGGQSSNR